MRTKTSSLRDYIEENGKLPDDCVLGYIAWFTIEDGMYDAEKMALAFDRLNLNSAYLPPPISPSDAFLKASTEIGGLEYAVVGGNTARVLVRDVVKGRSEIIRHIVREVVDAKNVQLLYEEVGEIVFYRPAVRGGVAQPGSARYRVTLSQTLVQEEKDILRARIADFESTYMRYRDFHDGAKLRALVRSYLLYLNGIAMKPSVYFVHSSRGDELERLQQFVAELRSGSTNITMLPLADLPTLRTEVVDAFQREAVKELQYLAEEIVSVRSTRKGPISVKKYAQLRDDYNRVMAKATEYTRTLQITQDRTAGAAETVIDLLTALQSDYAKQLDS